MRLLRVKRALRKCAARHLNFMRVSLQELDAPLAKTTHPSLERRMKEISNVDDACHDLETKIVNAIHLLESLRNEHQLVSQKTNLLHETCRSLLNQQKQLDSIVNDMKKPLEVFGEVVRLGKIFGMSLELSSSSPESPQRAFYRPRPESSEFRDALVRADECVAFIEAFPQYQAYAEYSRKFLQLQHRGLTLVRNFVTECIEKTSDAAEAALRAKVESKRDVTKEENMLMVRFKALATQLRTCISELETRASSGVARTAVDLLRDCQVAYCSKRAQLIEITLSKRTLASQVMEGAADSGGAHCLHAPRWCCATSRRVR